MRIVALAVTLVIALMLGYSLGYHRGWRDCNLYNAESQANATETIRGLMVRVTAKEGRASTAPAD